MRAVGVMVHGGPEALEVVDLPEVHAGPGQVRVRIYAAAVNPTDTMARNGSRAEQQKVDPPPYVPGMDAAGVVDEVGAGVSTGVQVGDTVMAMVVPKGSHGAYREQIVLHARAVVPAPAGTTHVEACTLPMNGLTARQSLDLLGLSAGQTLAVTGAAGAYGGYVVQLAKAEGLTVIADASEADHALVAALGADIVVRVLSDFAPTGSKPCFPPFTNSCFYSPREGATVSHTTPKSQFGAKSDRTSCRCQPERKRDRMGMNYVVKQEKRTLCVCSGATEAAAQRQPGQIFELR